MRPEILAFGRHCSANFQSILNCFIPNFKLKYEDSENIKTNANTVVFNLSQINERNFFEIPGNLLANRLAKKALCRKQNPGSQSAAKGTFLLVGFSWWNKLSI